MTIPRRVFSINIVVNRKDPAMKSLYQAKQRQQSFPHSYLVQVLNDFCSDEYKLSHTLTQYRAEVSEYDYKQITRWFRDFALILEDDFTVLGNSSCNKFVLIFEEK